MSTKSNERVSSGHQIETDKIQNETEMLRALYDFESTIPQTINFSKGDYFVLHPSINKQRNWWHVITAAGVVGYVPNNYVQTVEVGSKSVLDFLTKCIKSLERDVSQTPGGGGRRAELVAELKKRRHALALRLAPRDSRSPVPPQRISSTPSTPRCSSAMAFSSHHASNHTANHDDMVFTNLGKNATLPKSAKKREGGEAAVPKKPVRSATSEAPGLAAGGAEKERGGGAVMERPMTNGTPPADSAPAHSPSPSPETQAVYNLVQEVRHATHLKYELSKVAASVVLRGLQELLPSSAVPPIVALQRVLAGDLAVSGRCLDATHDARRLRTALQELVSCKEDAQQRSWELYEDEAVISEYIAELVSILENADPEISRRVLSEGGLAEVVALADYYQMEVRWPIRQLLISAFCAMCSVHPPATSCLLNSVLPLELARDMMSNTRNISKLTNSSTLLTRIFSTGESMPVNHLEHVGVDFMTFVLAFVEEPPETDSADVIPDTFLRVVLAYNLQFPDPRSNPVLEALARRNNAKVFTEKILLLLNREDDPVRPASGRCRSIFKMFHDLFSSDRTAGLVYTNDIKVLLDIVVRQLTDLSPGESRRSEYLRLCRMVLRNSSGYAEHRHRLGDLQKCFTRIFCEDSSSSLPDQALVRDISNEFPQYFKN